MRRWIVWIGGAAGLGLAAWYFGKPAEAPLVSVAKPQAAVEEAPKAPAPKMLEVIDLARAYEPVREPDEVYPGGVNPATFIQVPEAAERIPPARDGDDPYADVIRRVREEPSFLSRMWGAEDRERIDVMPREIWLFHPGQGFVPSWGPPGKWMYVLPASAVPAPVEQLDVMPREVEFNPTSLNFRATVTGELVFTPMGNTFGPHVEELDVMPREVPFFPIRFPCVCEPEVLTFVRAESPSVTTRIDLISAGIPFIPRGTWLAPQEWLETFFVRPPPPNASTEQLDCMPREVEGPMQDLLHFLPVFGWM